MSASPILEERAIGLLNGYMDEAGVPADERHTLLNSMPAYEWLALFQQRGQADGMDGIDFAIGKERLNERWLLDYPTAGGKTEAVLAER